MKIKMLSIALLAFCISSISFAAYSQKIELCLNIEENLAQNAFVASFASSDPFDSGNFIPPVEQNQRCVSHTYAWGPKNLKFDLSVYKPSSRVAKQTIITLDSSCSFMRNIDNTSVTSNYQRTNKPHEIWHLKISQVAAMQGYENHYVLKCEHKSY